MRINNNQVGAKIMYKGGDEKQKKNDDENEDESIACA